MLTIRLNAQSCTIVRHRSSGVEILASCDVSDVVDAAHSMEDANDEPGIIPLPPETLRRLLVDGLIGSLSAPDAVRILEQRIADEAGDAAFLPAFRRLVDQVCEWAADEPRNIELTEAVHHMRRASGNALVGVDGPRRFDASEKTISVTDTERETP